MLVTGSQSRSLARKEQWTDEQKAHYVVAQSTESCSLEPNKQSLMLPRRERASRSSSPMSVYYRSRHTSAKIWTTSSWSMRKQRDETVRKFSQRLKENVRMFADLPMNAAYIPEVQQCRERGKRSWHLQYRARSVQ
ncbi:hypothetical protein P3T76_008891 [Phytophthora citrophthora]|uniref:Uncharacterized protein n=1 Tax=Phytophthora citrophthora TaxID=4793 RepID=A0AAD9GHZ3_9STRA|nr:hypothetical protein P3T76_008891 [Phytophthora citrophthora]